MLGMSKCCRQDCQIVAFAHQRDKAEGPNTRAAALRRDATIRLARLHLLCRGQMSREQCDRIRGHSFPSIFEAFQGRIEQCPAARAFFTIDDGDVATGQILDGLDASLDCRER